VGEILEEAASRFAREVRDGVYPDAEHSYT
jgi:ketopantoate hydroxymethyltransferase